MHDGSAAPDKIRLDDVAEIGSGDKPLLRRRSVLSQHLTGEVRLARDEHGRIRLDDWEFAAGVQDEVRTAWDSATAEGKVPEPAARWFFDEVYRLYGFGVAGVDYSVPTEV